MLFPRNSTLKFIAAAVGMSLIFLDQSCLSIILFPICKALNLDKNYIAIIASAYTLGMFSCILFAGQLIDQFGWQKIYGLGLVTFAITSMGCGVSNNANIILISRFLQGVGAGLILPSIFVLANTEFANNKKGSVIGSIIGIGSISFALGPIAASQIVNYLSWQYIFLINIPICIITFIVVIKLHAKVLFREVNLTKIDFYGWIFLLLIVINVMILFLIQSQSRIIFEILLFLLGFLFLYVEIKGSYPLFNIKIFRNKKFLIASCILFLVQINITSVIFWSLFLQQFYKLPLAILGIALLPCFLPAVLLSGISGVLYDKHGEKPIFISSLCIISVGLIIISGSFSLSGRFLFILGMVFYGIGTALIIPVLNTVILSAVDFKTKGSAAGMFQTIRQVCGSISTIFFSWVLLNINGEIVQYNFLRCYLYLAIITIIIVCILSKFYNFKKLVY